MNQEQDIQKLEMAQRYRQHLLGHAYIPLQDLPKYEKAFKEIYEKTKN